MTPARQIAILAVLCGTSISLAQGPATDETLRGPTVADTPVPGASTQFGEPTGKPDKFHRDPKIAHRHFMDAVRSLEDPALAADLQLTQDQLAKINAIDAEFRAQVDAFRAEHKEEIDALKAKAGDIRAERRERGAKDKAADKQAKRAGKALAKSDPEIAAARDQLKALMDAGPSPQDANERMWAVLSPAQQALAQSRIDAARDDRRERIGHEMRERRPPGPDDDRGPRADRERRPPPSPLAGEGGRAQRPGEGQRFAGPPPMRDFEPTPPNPRLANLIDRFNALPPEAQDRIIQRMEEMLSRMDGRRGPKPAPPMDDVDVPPPLPPDDDAGDPMPPPAPEPL